LFREAIKTNGGRSKASWASKVDLYADALEAYQAWKIKEGWWDGDDLYEEALRRVGGFPETGTVLFYGFYDATVLQERVLGKLETEGSAWFVPYLETPAYEYAKTFVRRLSQSGGLRMLVTAGPSDGKNPPYPDFLAHNLFTSNLGSPLEGDPKLPSSFESSPFKIVLCPGERREARELSRVARSEVTRLGLNFRQCAVLLRTPEVYRSALTGEMDAQGLPYESRIGVSLSETLQGKAFVRLTEALWGGFERGPVMDFLSSPGLNPASFLSDGRRWSPAIWDTLTKEARVVSGRTQWRQRLGRWMDSRKARGGPDESGGFGIEAAEALLQTLEPLLKSAEVLERSNDWGKALVLLEGLVRRHFSKGEETERLADLLANSSWIAELSRGLHESDFAQVLRSLLDEETISARGSQEGGVQVLDLMQSRGVPHEVVLFPGLVERSVPRPTRGDPFLSDDEREAMNEATGSKGCRLALKRDAALEEKMLFTLAMASARKVLVLSAPVLDPQKGVERVPSLYLYETLRAVTGIRSEALENLPGVVRNVQIGDWALSDPLEAVDEMERTFSVTALAKSGFRFPALGYLKRHPLGMGGFASTMAREGSNRFTAFDGMLPEGSQPSAPSAFSPTRIETYAKCPQMYFYRYVLGLTPLQEPEEELEAEVMETGNLMHHVLEKAVARGLKEGWLKARSEDEASKVVAEETEEALRVFEEKDVTGASCLWAWKKRSLREDLQRAMRKILKDPEWFPHAVETSVQGGRSLDVGDGLTVELKGRADRFDLSADGRSFRVVDYKSGSATDYANNTLRGGRRIQLALYLWAGQHVFPGLRPHSGIYEFLTAKGDYKEVVLEAEEWKEMEDKLRLILRECRDGIVRGRFPAFPSKDLCGHCEVWTLCGSGMERRAERKSTDPALEGLLKVREIR
jgi:RecB family exonuclease